MLGLDCRDYYNEDKLMQRLKMLDDLLDHVIVEEFMEESFILLKEKIPLSVVNILFTKANIEDRPDLKNEEKLSQILWPDFLLYEHFMDKLLFQMEENQKMMATQQTALSQIEDKYEEVCGRTHEAFCSGIKRHLKFLSMRGSPPTRRSVSRFAITRKTTTRRKRRDPNDVAVDYINARDEAHTAENRNWITEN